MKVIKSVILGSFAIGFLTYFYRYNPNRAGDGYFLPCPIKYFSGWDCPGCGSQRLLYNLLHFNLKEALQNNALLFIGLPFIFYLLFIFIANQFFGTQYRIKFLYNNRMVWGLFALIVGFGILRNLPFEPFCLLAAAG